jgi:tetratricopeptide repeat protein 8
MVKEAERQLLSSIKSQDMVLTHLELAKVYMRRDQALKTIEVYKNGLETHPFEVHLYTGISRTYEQINDPINSNKLCKNVLNFDNTNMEAIATLACYHFYTNQPEIALRYYRRLIQCGVYNAELWNNVGLC